MRNSPFISALAVATLTLPYAAAAQGPQVQMTPSGTPAAELPLEQLPDGFQAYALGVASPSSSMETVLGLYGRVGSGPNSDLADMLNAYWTKGDVVTGLGDSRFLVTYRVDAPSRMATVFGTWGSSPATPEAPAKLRLVLVRLDSVLTISPIAKASKQLLLEVIGTPAQRPIAVLKTTTMSNMKQAALGMTLYTTDYDDVYPWVQSSRAAYEVTFPYVKNKEIFKTLNPNGGQIQFAMNLGGVESTTLDNPAETPMYYESAAWPDGSRIVSYADGHTKTVTAAQWPRVEEYLRKVYKRKAKKPLPASTGRSFTLDDAKERAATATSVK